MSNAGTLILDRTSSERKVGYAKLIRENSEEDLNLALEDMGVSGEATWDTGTDLIMWQRAINNIEKKISENEKVETIWDKSNIKAMLEEPVGNPVYLSREEAEEIASLAFGSNPSLPRGEDYVRQVRSIFGKSLMRKIKRASG